MNTNVENSGVTEPAGGSLDDLIRKRPEIENAALRVAAKYRISEDDPGWVFAALVSDADAAAARASAEAAKAGKLMEVSVDVLRKTGEGAGEAIGQIPTLIRAGAQRAGDDARWQIMLAGQDAAKQIRGALAAAAEVAASVAAAAQELVRKAGPGLLRASSGGSSKSKWMLAGLAILFAGVAGGAGGAYYATSAAGRITPSYLTSQTYPNGWTVLGPRPGHVRYGGHRHCPRGDWLCIAR